MYITVYIYYFVVYHLIIALIRPYTGVGALYAGLPPTLIRTFIASGALFVTVEYSKRYMHRHFD